MTPSENRDAASPGLRIRIQGIEGRSRVREVFRRLRSGGRARIAPVAGRIELLVILPKGLGSVGRNRIRRRVRAAVLELARKKGLREGVIAVRANSAFLDMRWQEILEAVDSYVPDNSIDQ